VELCQHVLTQLPNPPTELFFVSYSYGSTVAASALAQVPQVRCCLHAHQQQQQACEGGLPLRAMPA
jgi:hypothetical protein